ncbi:MAG: hypothetical protein ACUVV0_06055 [Anaerolineae bacterium]
MAMRKFQCADCGYVFEMAYGTGTPGAQMTCPACGSRNVHRAPDDRGHSRAGRGRGGPGRGPR